MLLTGVPFRRVGAEPKHTAEAGSVLYLRAFAADPFFRRRLLRRLSALYFLALAMSAFVQS